MINLQHSNFFLPTKQFRELSILLSIMHEPEVSQQHLAERTNLSVSMVNGYIKVLHQKELIEVADKNRRDKLYLLTDRGRNQLMQSLMHCSAEIVQLYRQAKTEIIQKLQHHFNGNGPQRLILYGGADTAQLVNNALEKFPQVALVAIVDSDPDKWGVKIGNHVIQSPEIITKAGIDCVVISSFARQDEIYQSIRNFEAEGIRLIRLTSP